MGLFDFCHGLIGVSRIGNKALMGAVGEQIQLFEDRLANEHFIPQDQCFLQCVAAQTFDDKRFRHADRFLATVRIFRDTLPTYLQSQVFHNLRRNHRAHRACVHQCIQVAAAHLRVGNLPTARQHFVQRVGQSYFDTYFTHTCNSSDR
jgi:hypothetical protein